MSRGEVLTETYGALMELPWHTGVKASLGAAIDNGRLPHAVLLSGYPGWGEAELCAWLAAVLLGVDAARDPRTLAHPDCRWIAPEGASIKVDQIRSLAEFVPGTPQIAAAKVAVIENAHCMNVNAQNALLKTLEEPPGPMFLILGTHRAGSLSPTVLSRCQQFAIPRDRAAAAHWLREPAARALLDDYGGAPLDAMRGSRAGERPLVELLADLAAGQPVIDELLGLDAARLSARWARRLVRMLGGGPETPSGAVMNPRRAFAFAGELTRFHDQVTRSSAANVRLLLERLCHHWRLLVRPH